MTDLQAKIIQLSAQGLTSYAQIAELAGCHPVYVGQVLGTKVDSDEWETERQRHAEFFGGLTPQQEFDRHTIERKRMESEDE
jgi:alkylated DNA nucleotide flippase Atl1